MKPGWKFKAFEECIERVTYTTKIQRKDFQVEGRFPIVSQEEAPINGYWDNLSDVFQVKRPLVVFGDHTRCFKYIDFDFVLGADGVKILQPIGALDPRFFYYQLLSFSFASLGYARHYRLLKESKICVPPLDEQRRIVAVLDKAFAGIATATSNAQINLTNASALFESYLSFLLSNRDENWINRRLGSVATLQRGFDLPTQNRKPGKVPLISSSGVIARVSEARVQGPGVTTGRSGSIGNVFYIAGPYWPLNTSLYVKDFHGNDPRFVFWLLKNFNLGKYATGSGVPTLNRNFVHEEEVWLPRSREAQLEIGLKLDKFDFECSKLEALTTKRIVALSELRQSLLHKAFAGELT